MEEHGHPYGARSPAWEELESGKMAGAEAGMSGAGIQQQPQHPAAVGAAVGAADESSDSEGEHEGPQKLIRKVSTSGQIRSKPPPLQRGAEGEAACFELHAGAASRCSSL